jgi:hypothetical protein
MLTRVAIFACIVAVCLASDAERVSDREFTQQWRREQKRHGKLASEPTPREWRADAVWRFVTTPPPGKAKLQVLTFRVTDQAGVSCLGGWKDAWRKLVVLKGHVAFGSPTYQVEGRALQINLSGDMCDASDIIRGVLIDGRFEGERITFGLGSPTEVIGTVRGSLVQQ